MDEELKKRQWRLKEAEHNQDTTRHWELQVSAIEESFIRYFQLTGTDAKNMRGRAAPRLIDVEEEPVPSNAPPMNTEERSLRQKRQHL